jgi:hypothetical protein
MGDIPAKLAAQNAKIVGFKPFVAIFLVKMQKLLHKCKKFITFAQF